MTMAFTVPLDVAAYADNGASESAGNSLALRAALTTGLTAALGAEVAVFSVDVASVEETSGRRLAQRQLLEHRGARRKLEGETARITVVIGYAMLQTSKTAIAERMKCGPGESAVANTVNDAFSDFTDFPGEPLLSGGLTVESVAFPESIFAVSNAEAAANAASARAAWNGTEVADPMNDTTSDADDFEDYPFLVDESHDLAAIAAAVVCPVPLMPVAASSVHQIIILVGILVFLNFIRGNWESIQEKLEDSWDKFLDRTSGCRGCIWRRFSERTQKKIIAQ